MILSITPETRESTWIDGGGGCRDARGHPFLDGTLADGDHRRPVLDTRFDVEGTAKNGVLGHDPLPFEAQSDGVRDQSRTEPDGNASRYVTALDGVDGHDGGWFQLRGGRGKCLDLRRDQHAAHLVAFREVDLRGTEGTEVLDESAGGPWGHRHDGYRGTERGCCGND